MPERQEFDYIIVGAGSAGCVLANRLSADPDIRVCLVEAGKKDTSLLVRMPAGVGSLLKGENDYNWGFETEPQAHMNGRRLYWPRGRGWGGSSSINGMVYIRGHARDYDQWRQMGLEGWGFADVLPYFRRSETFDGGEDEFHGGDGPLHVSQSPLNAPLYDAFIEAGQQAGHAFTPDFNGAQQEGVGPYQRTIHKGERWSASFGYLRPIAGKRDNLTVISTGLVTRVLVEDGRARGVEIVEGKGREPSRLRAAGEVIVCAGAVQSPQLLMLSGIGDPDTLKAHGIAPQVESPDIGTNLQDHLDVILVHEMTQKLSAYSQQAGLKKLGVGLRYLFSKSGPGADNFLQAGAFLKSREGLDRPDLQLHLVNACMIDHGRVEVKKDGFTVHACQLRPESRGTVGLRSADPFDHPAIDPNYLAAQEDRRAMRESVRIMREICAQAGLADLRGPEMLPGPDVQSDEQIDAYVRETGETIYHPVGTVRMGNDARAPLDGALRLRGVEGLRVVDASVMPTLIGGNTNAPTIMIAEKAADMILGRPAVRDEATLAA
ncbi:MAG: choline dehydrogenase [Alphaproteobacteria bacterium]|jgi:choline dehydrogenase|nr:choline dehydrogenase [Alphaproteobacteria bacterium]